MAATISANSAGGGGLVTSGDASGVLALQTAGVTALSIDASQVITLVNALGGTPSAPTAAVNTSTPQIATTAFANPASLLAANGYVKLPSGVILQWGSASGTSPVVTFPIAFPTALGAAFSMPTNASTSAPTPYISAKSTTGFTVTFVGTSSTWNWFAIGY